MLDTPSRDAARWLASAGRARPIRAGGDVAETGTRSAAAEARARPAEPGPRDGAEAAPALHRRRHPRHRRLRAHRSGRGRGRWRGVGAVPGRVRRRAAHGVLVPRAGDEVPAGGRRGALRAQGVGDPLPHVHGRVHGDVLGHHVGLDCLARVRGQPVGGLRARPSATAGSS